MDLNPHRGTYLLNRCREFEHAAKVLLVGWVFGFQFKCRTEFNINAHIKLVHRRLGRVFSHVITKHAATVVVVSLEAFQQRTLHCGSSAKKDVSALLLLNHRRR